MRLPPALLSSPWGPVRAARDAWRSLRRCTSRSQGRLPAMQLVVPGVLVGFAVFGGLGALLVVVAGVMEEAFALLCFFLVLPFSVFRLPFGVATVVVPEALVDFAAWLVAVPVLRSGFCRRCACASACN